MKAQASFINKSKIKEFLPLKFVVPNMITLLALSCGVTAIQAAAAGKWSFAAVLIIVAAFFDGLDGRIARLLSGTSKFGAELDSLSDFISFGVAPAVVMYFFALDAYPKIGWALALFLAICCALRLARFNTMLEEKHKPYWDYFFTGVPAPAGAAIAILPLILSRYSDYYVFSSFGFSAFCVILSAVLMASRVPTICVKKVKVKAEHIPLVLAAVALWIGFLFADFWLASSIMIICYIISIPFGVMAFYRMRKNYEKK